eukprot:TRINITY_DN180_c0_g1_i1.p1 TRINITY_DN180_c0_g1~~TRINITY_DN180_c0_g1_i1.p1  ORF type:complete len:412 (-),score=176.01 TRINITY_DN180_c0_g1_i1:263-1432(-)
MKVRGAILFFFAALLMAALAVWAQEVEAPDDRYFNGVLTLTGFSESVPESFDIDPEQLTFVTGSLGGAGLLSAHMPDVDHAAGTVPLERYGSSASDDVLVSASGVRVDVLRDAVYVANARFPEPSSVGGVAVFRRPAASDTASLAYYADVSALHPTRPKIVNDVAFDRRGHIFATESLNGVIYRVDRDTEQAEVWKEDAQLRPQDDVGIGANGIVFFDGDDDADREALLVGRSGASVEASGIFRVSMRSREVRRVVVTAPRREDPFGFDGLALDERGRLWAAAPLINKVFELETEDRWESASLIATYDTACNTPTSVKVQGSQVYVLCAEGFGEGAARLERIPTGDDDDDASNDDGDRPTASPAAAPPLPPLLPVALLAFVVAAVAALV